MVAIESRNPSGRRGGRAIQALGLFQALMALTVLLAPEYGSRLAGMSWERATGEAMFGWRRFAVRQLCLGLGGIAGAQPARYVNRYIQPADLALFVHARRTQSVPRRTSTLALAAATCALGCVLADYRASRRAGVGETPA